MNALQSSELKAYISERLKDESFLTALYTELGKIYDDERQILELDENDITRIIIERGILEKILGPSAQGNLDPKEISKDQLNQASASDDHKERRFRLKVTLNEVKGYCLFDDQSFKKELYFVIAFLGQKKISQGFSITKIIRIGQSFEFNFGRLHLAEKAAMSHLALLKAPITFLIYEKNDTDGKKQLLSIKDIEWRFILAHKSLTLNMELPDIRERSLSIGILNFDVVLLSDSRSTVLVDEDKLENQLAIEKEVVALRTKRFFEFSRNWWAEYKSLDPTFATRAVKIYASDLYGTLKPVNYFVDKLRCRAISTAEEAARFVALIPFEAESPIDGEKSDWRDSRAFLSEGRGNAIDHSLLLCSLLLGFCLDAYVCLGSCSDGAHAWVMTIEERKVGNKLMRDIRFWESLTGKIYNRNDPRVNFLYRKIGCAFNDQIYLANLQKEDTVTKRPLIY